MDDIRVLTGTRDPLAELEDLCHRWEGHVLLALASQGQKPMQFADLARAVTSRADEWYSSSQLVTLLKRMTARGIVSWDYDPHRHKRYQLTDLGRQRAERLAFLLQLLQREACMPQGAPDGRATHG